MTLSYCIAVAMKKSIVRTFVVIPDAPKYNAINTRVTEEHSPDDLIPLDIAQNY